jgi:hypothetical protein
MVKLKTLDGSNAHSEEMAPSTPSTIFGSILISGREGEFSSRRQLGLQEEVKVRCSLFQRRQGQGRCLA